LQKSEKTGEKAFSAAGSPGATLAEMKIVTGCGTRRPDSGRLATPKAPCGPRKSHLPKETFLIFIRINKCGCSKGSPPVTPKLMIVPLMLVGSALLLVCTQPGASCVLTLLAKIAANISL
jgi:hypothetical protein